jgi:hypothetical protein
MASRGDDATSILRASPWTQGEGQAKAPSKRAAFQRVFIRITKLEEFI